MTFTRQILLGLLLGVFLGIFLGELAAPLSIGGEIYIALLQMTVLPYIVVSLIANLGRVSWAQSRGLLLTAVLALATLLGLGILMLAATPLAFPPWESASFFRSSLVESPPALDLVALYIPANPFSSLSNNVVPAVVLFCILLGAGISGLPGSAGFLRGLDVLEAGLNRVNKLVIKLTPYGVFAIAAGTAGTISLDELSRIQAYLLTYTVIALILSFVTLPLLVSAVTPFSYRDIVAVPKDTLIMIFAAAKIIVLMPQLVENVKELFRRYELQDEQVDSGAEVLMPLAYPFPNLGTFTILMFVPFAAWYMGRELDMADQLVFQAASLLSSFVAPIIGIPFLLDLMRIPADVMELFMMSTVYTDRIRVVLGAVHLLSLTVVVLAYRRGVFRPNLPGLLRALAISAAAIGVALVGLRFYLGSAMSESYHGDEALVQMRWMNQTAEVNTFKETLPPADGAHLDLGRVDAIRARGSVRVGYLADSLPFAFSNEQGEVIGFDIELAHMLANDLDVRLELVRVKMDDISGLFESGQLDIVMSGLAVTATRALQWEFAASPMDLTVALLVPDHRRKAFSTFDRLRSQPRLRIGIVQADSAMRHSFESALPNLQLEHVDSPREFLRGNRPELDAVIYSAEGGSAWTLIYPEYSVVVPQPARMRLSMGYPVPRGEREWARFVEEWVRVRRKDGTVDALFQHWIEGRGAEDTTPRWSIVRNVLGWVE